MTEIPIFAAAAVLPAQIPSIGGVVVGAWSAATVFWMGIGAGIWRLFFEPRVKELKEQLDTERERCDDEIAALRDRIKQLELLLLLHGPQALRNQLQAALSEKEIEIHRARAEKT